MIRIPSDKDDPLNERYPSECMHKRDDSIAANRLPLLTQSHNRMSPRLISVFCLSRIFLKGLREFVILGGFVRKIHLGFNNCIATKAHVQPCSGLGLFPLLTKGILFQKGWLASQNSPRPFSEMIQKFLCLLLRSFPPDLIYHNQKAIFLFGFPILQNPNLFCQAAYMAGPSEKKN